MKKKKEKLTHLTDGLEKKDQVLELWCIKKRWK